MKKYKILNFLMVVIISLTFIACGNKEKGNTLNDIKNKGKFVVGLDDSFPPMGFRSEKEEIVGFDIDLAKEVAKRMKLNVEFKTVEWDGVIGSLNNGDIDLIWNGLTITENRKKQIEFSNPYLENKQIIVVNKESNIGSKKGLKGKIVGVQMGSSSYEAFSKDEEISNNVVETKKYSKNTEALMDLEAKRIDAVVVDEVVGRYYISKKPGLYKVLSEDFGREQYGVGFRKEEIEFKKEVDKILDQMKKDGTTESISKKWFGENIIK